jgi:DNA-binding MarR family transcriptional regulator
VSTPGHERTRNTAVLLREAFRALNDLVLDRLAAAGHEQVRPAQAAVFQYLDDDGTTVSTLAGRAQMTKQAMAELVRQLEDHRYVVRVPDPTDGRAKLVTPTDRGRDVFRIVTELVPEIETSVAEAVGAERVRELHRDLDAIRRTARRGLPAD